MKTLSVDQQVENLRPAVKSGLAANFHNWLVVAAAVLVILSLLLWNPVPLMIAIFLGVVGLSERRAGPNMSAAVAAYDTIRPTLGEVSITISCGDADNHYHALVCEHGQPEWAYEFILQGWEPAEGSYAARIWRPHSGGPPLLAAVDSGILIPRYDPTSPKSVSESTAR